MAVVIVFILMLGLLIFVHELGHFIVARRSGVKAEEFGFGFPPRIAGVVKAEPDSKKKTTPWEFILGNKEVKRKDTLYSLNWIPLGGFVRIKGEDGAAQHEKDSFASQSAWKRIKILGAGVSMNFLLAWLLISAAFMIGAPEAVEEGTEIVGSASTIQIIMVAPGSPAEEGGMLVGDKLVGCEGQDSRCEKGFQSISEVQAFTDEHRGEKVTLRLQRGRDEMSLSFIPRENPPEGEGALGISMTLTAIIKHSLWESLWLGTKATGNLIIFILTAFGTILKNLILGEPLGLDVAGPVGIATMTKQATQLGFVYVLQFAALISINLGIINALPFPALDGGRILFILIEKIKGSPVSQKVERVVHASGFVLLILLMIFVTARDVAKLDLFERFFG